MKMLEKILGLFLLILNLLIILFIVLGCIVAISDPLIQDIPFIKFIVFTLCIIAINTTVIADIK